MNGATIEPTATADLAYLTTLAKRARQASDTAHKWGNAAEATYRMLQSINGRQMAGNTLDRYTLMAALDLRDLTLHQTAMARRYITRTSHLATDAALAYYAGESRDPWRTAAYGDANGAYYSAPCHYTLSAIDACAKETSDYLLAVCYRRSPSNG